MKWLLFLLGSCFTDYYSDYRNSPTADADAGRHIS